MKNTLTVNTSNKKLVLIPLVWWSLLLYLNYLNIGTYGRISGTAYEFYIVMLISLFVGYLPGFFIKNQQVTFSIQKKGIKIIYAVYAFLILLLIALLFKSSLFKIGYFNYYLEIRVFENFSVIGISKFVDNILKSLFLPLIQIVTIIWLFFIEKPKLKYPLSFLPMAMFSLLFQTNFNYIFLFGVVLLYNLEYAKRNYSFLLFIFAVIISMAILRGGTDIYYVLQRYFIDYFTLGFNLFDYYITSNFGYMMNHSYGMSSLSIFDQFISRLTGDIAPVWAANQEMLNEKVKLTSNFLYQPNAFGTIAFVLYKDFGFIGSVIGGYAVGLTFFLLERWKSVTSKITAFYLAYYVLVGMMVPPLIQLWFWVGFIYLIIFNIYSQVFYEKC